MSCISFSLPAIPPTNGATTFSVDVNGEKLLTGFDVVSDALAAYVADERVFRDVSPASNGLLHLSFISERGAHALSTIETLSGIPKQRLPIRLVMQPTSFTDHKGQFWHPDNYYTDGYTSTKRMRITGTADPNIFMTSETEMRLYEAWQWHRAQGSGSGSQLQRRPGFAGAQRRLRQ
jgi:hypothetical protein